MISTRQLNDLSCTVAFKSVFVGAVIATFLAACGGGGGGSASAVGGGGSPGGSGAIGGAVVKGPVQGATLIVSTLAGSPITFGFQGSDNLSEAVLDNTAQFSIELDEADLPVLLSATGGTDSVTMETPPIFSLKGVVSEVSSGEVSNVTLSPVTTLAVLIAQSGPGGLTTTAYETALAALLNNFPLGLDGIAGDVTLVTAEDADFALFLLASEALGEVIRRTAASTGAEPEAVLETLARDLVDGLIDGVAGTAGPVDGLTALYANLHSAVIVLEMIEGNLTVNGGAFTEVELLNALKVVFPTAALAEFPFSLCEDQLTQLRIAVAAANSIAPAAALDLLTVNLDQLLLTLGATKEDQEDQCILDNQLMDFLDETPNPSGTLDGALAFATGLNSDSLEVGQANALVRNAVDESGLPYLEPDEVDFLPVILEWTRPMLLTDGSLLTDAEIARYRIHIGFSSRNYSLDVQERDNSVSLGDPDATTETDPLIEGVPHYIAVTTVTTSGVESSLSNEVCVEPPSTPCGD